MKTDEKIKNKSNKKTEEIKKFLAQNETLAFSDDVSDRAIAHQAISATEPAKSGRRHSR